MLPHLPRAPFNVGAKPNKPAVAKPTPQSQDRSPSHDVGLSRGINAPLVAAEGDSMSIHLSLPTSMLNRIDTPSRLVYKHTHTELNRIETVSPVRPLLGSIIVDFF